jgi:hypothetical protein
MNTPTCNRRQWLVGGAHAALLATAAWHGGASATTSATAPPRLPDALASQWPQARLVGQGRLRFFGLDVYDAHLWADPGLDPADWSRHRLALALTYWRSLDGTRIAERSLKEMAALPGYDAAQGPNWLARMNALFPNVGANDVLVGVHEPARGASFWFNGQPLGEVADPQFSRLFFGIWLAPTTSEPRLRQALLAAAGASPSVASTPAR